MSVCVCLQRELLLLQEGHLPGGDAEAGQGHRNTYWGFSVRLQRKPQLHQGGCFPGGDAKASEVCSERFGVDEETDVAGLGAGTSRGTIRLGRSVRKSVHLGASTCSEAAGVIPSLYGLQGSCRQIRTQANGIDFTVFPSERLRCDCECVH